MEPQSINWTRFRLNLSLWIHDAIALLNQKCQGRFVNGSGVFGIPEESVVVVMANIVEDESEEAIHASSEWNCVDVQRKIANRTFGEEWKPIWTEFEEVDYDEDMEVKYRELVKLFRFHTLQVFADCWDAKPGSSCFTSNCTKSCEDGDDLWLFGIEAIRNYCSQSEL